LKQEMPPMIGRLNKSPASNQETFSWLESRLEVTYPKKVIAITVRECVVDCKCTLENILCVCEIDSRELVRTVKDYNW